MIAVAWAAFVFLAWKSSRAPEFVPQELEDEVALAEGESPAADELRYAESVLARSNGMIVASFAQ